MRRPRQGGFTLIELIVVLIVVGTATTTISLSVHSDSAGLLCQDVACLTRLLEIVQGEARVCGMSILWQPSTKGYCFSLQVYRDKADAFAIDTKLRMCDWQVALLWISVCPPRLVLLDVE